MRKLDVSRLKGKFSNRIYSLTGSGSVDAVIEIGVTGFNVKYFEAKNDKGETKSFKNIVHAFEHAGVELTGNVATDL